MRKAALVALLLALVPDSPASGAISGLQLVANGLNSPIFVTHAPGDASRIFVAERGGAIKTVNLSTGVVSPFLNMTGISTTNEGGFLGLAFHPQYNTVGADGFGKFYVNVTTASPFTTRIREFKSPSNANDLSSQREILSFTQPATNHNGGWIGFSPNDGYLYIASGDGGGSNDNGPGHTPGIGNAQDIEGNLLGKMLRIDVNSDGFPSDSTRNYAVPPSNPFVGTAGLDEIWAYGLRNPFRSSFDRATGDLWMGDVGQDNREEIDLLPAGSDGGQNYGWRLREGQIETPGVGDDCDECEEPEYDYGRLLAQTDPPNPAITEVNKYRGGVVTGGYVYRGPDPTLRGKYFFLDSQNTASATDDNYWFFDPANPGNTVANLNDLFPRATNTAQRPVSFGEDLAGNLYITYLSSGEVYRIGTNQLLIGDYDLNNVVDNNDWNTWRSFYGTISPSHRADGSSNGVVDALDYVLWRINVGASIPDSTGGGGATVPEPIASIAVLQALLLGVFIRMRSTNA